MAEISEKFETIILVPCSGSEYNGELARQVAIRIAEKSQLSAFSSMTCSTIFFKNILLGKDKLVEITKNHLKNSFIILIDGCNTGCESSIYEHLKIVPDLLISVQDIVPKQRMNLKDLSTFKKLPKLSQIKEEDIKNVSELIFQELKKKGLDFDKFNEN